MIYAFMYLLIGVGNYAAFAVGSTGATSGPIEAAFFILLWPLQVLFKVVVGISMATDWLLGKFFGA